MKVERRGPLTKTCGTGHLSYSDSSCPLPCRRQLFPSLLTFKNFLSLFPSYSPAFFFFIINSFFFFFFFFFHKTFGQGSLEGSSSCDTCFLFDEKKLPHKVYGDFFFL